MSEQRPQAGDDHPEVITEVSVSEISLERTGTLRERKNPAAGSAVSRVALGLGVFSLLFAPVFGVGVVPAIVGIIVGHIAKRGEAVSRIRATIGLALSYVGLAIGTAILILVALPIVLAFLVSTGYVLGD
ncbi:MAG: hypothetical protein HOJ98_06425 [Microbacteriaceae bacterium]|jgi:hypothetical protein|nr:hypothetical protein [Microbacteriaceae bacterium]